jgi:flagellar basal-body rod modification protein FlgD
MSAAGTSSAATVSRIPIKTLGQEDFLKLLVTQMSNQDPMSPQKDTEFIAQMAQFTSLEQTRGMQADLAQLRSDQQLVQANALLGRAVELQVDATTEAKGTVSSIQIQDGTPKILVNGQAYDLNQVRSVLLAGANS